MDKFHKMDLNYYKNLLHTKLNKSDKKQTTIEEYEQKYQQLISTYSIAYLEGSDWYVGQSFTEYLQKESIYKMIPIKLKILCNILDTL